MTEAECMIIDTSNELKTRKSPDEDLPPAKKLKESDSKLKQARLPFKPLDQKPQLVPSSTPPGSKKRKHSDGESPCAKPPKTAKSVTLDKPVIVENDPEVSSSSEAENIPQQSLKTRVRNTLERFMRRQSQDEISSTNQCIDLTDVIGDEKEVDQKDNDDKNSDLNKENEFKSKVATGDGEKDKIENKVVRVFEKENENNKQEKCDADKGQEDDQATGGNKLDKKENEPEKTESDDLEEEHQNLDISMEANDGNNEKQIESDENAQNCNISDTSSCSDQQTPAKSKPCDTNLDTPVSAKLSDSVLRTPVSDSTPGPKTTPLSQSPENSCSDGTPKTSAKKAPRRLSDTKKKERDLLRNKIKEEKEKEREEKKRQKEQERLEKEKQKEKLKKEREEAKAEKDRQRKEEKEKKEKERLEKLQQKEEEKRKKQDIQDAKMEEKKKKEEEKQKEEEEKRQKEMKSKEKFTSFFIKQKTSPVSKSNKENSGLFMPFELKKDMMLAPCFDREGLSEDRKMNIDEALLSQDKSKSELYLAELAKDQYKPVKTEKTCQMELDHDVMLVHDSETVKKVTYHCKLLQFHTNYRPPYYGTWRRKSKVLTPRNPFKTDSDMLDYEVDSDDEWEEEEPGESLSASEGEEEKEENSDDEEEDGWMVPHGYLSEDEGCEADEEVTPEMLKARRKAKADQWESELKRQTQPAIHTIIGCFWEHAAQKIQKDLEERLKSYMAVCVGTVGEPIPTTFTGAHLKKGDNSNSDKKDDSRIHAQRKPVPEEAMPDLIRLVHGNLVGIKKLVREFRLYWKQKTSPPETEDAKDVSMDVDESENNGNTKGDNSDEKQTENENGKDDSFAISKRQLEMKISSIAMREKRESYKKICWYVHESVQQQYGMTDLPVPSKWEFISQPHKTPNRPKPEDTPGSGRKTPTPTVERKTPTVSITQFTRPMSPSTLQAQFAAANAAALAEKQRIAEEQAAKLAAQNAASNTSNTVNAVVRMDCTEAAQPKKDQRSIKDFAKNIFSPPKTHEWKMVHSGSGSPRDGKRLVLISNSFTSPKSAMSTGGDALINKQKVSPKCSNTKVKPLVSKRSPSIHKITSSPKAESNSAVASKNRVIPVCTVDKKSTAIIDFSNVDSKVSSTTSNIQPSHDDSNCHGNSIDDAIVLD